MRYSLSILAILAAGCVVIALLPACSLFSSADTLETPEWFLNDLPAPSSATVKELTDSVIPSLVNEECGYWLKGKTLDWRIDTVGSLAGQTVVDVFGTIEASDWEDSTKRHTHKAIKATAMETSRNEYRLVYAKGGGVSEIYFEPSHLIQVDGTEVLYTKSRLGGQEAFYDEACWIWNEDIGIPQRLEIWRQLVAVQYQLFPAGHRYVHGEFNFDSMCLQGWTVKNGDDYRHPSGGYAKIQLGIEAGNLTLKRASLDYGNVEFFARQEIERSADSAYLRQPVRLVDKMPGGGEENPSWLTYEYLEGYVESPPSSILDSLIIRGITGLCGFHVKQDSVSSNLETRPLGLIAGHKVVEVDYSLQHSYCQETSGRAFAIEVAPSEYRLFCLDNHVEGHWSAAEYKRLFIEGRDIVAVCKSGAYADRIRSEYWVWDAERNCLVSLYKDWALNETLRLLAPRHLPKDLTARARLGEWDVETLTYETYTWRAGDKNEKPSGGKLKIRFGVKSNRMLPKEFSFNPLDTLVSRE